MEERDKIALTVVVTLCSVAIAASVICGIQQGSWESGRKAGVAERNAHYEQLIGKHFDQLESEDHDDCPARRHE